MTIPVNHQFKFGYRLSSNLYFPAMWDRIFLYQQVYTTFLEIFGYVNLHVYGDIIWFCECFINAQLLNGFPRFTVSLLKYRAQRTDYDVILMGLSLFGDSFGVVKWFNSYLHTSIAPIQAPCKFKKVKMRTAYKYLTFGEYVNMSLKAVFILTWNISFSCIHGKLL